MAEGSGQTPVVPEESSRWVPIREAARLLGVSIDTIRRWDEKGIIHSNRLKGRNRYFEVSELEKVKSGQPLTISEAAKTLGISASTLRRLEKSGTIIPERSASGERLYSQEKIQQFQTNKKTVLKNRKRNIPKEDSVKKLLVAEPQTRFQKLKAVFAQKLPLGAAAAVLLLLAIASWGKAMSPSQPGKSFIAWNESDKLALINDEQPSSTLQTSSPENEVTNPSSSPIPKIAGLIRQNLIKNSLNYAYDQESGHERAIAVDDKGLSFDVYAPGEYLYIDLREDNTKFVVRDHESDVLTIDSDKHIIAHEGSQVNIRGTLKLDGNGGNENEALISTGKNSTPIWKDLSELFVKNDGDEMTGNLTLESQSDLRFGGQDTENYVGFQAPADISTSFVWTLPATDGTNNQVLKTNGSGQLSWTSSGGGGFTSFTLAGDTGSSQTIEDGNTLTIATGGALTATAGATDTVTLTIDADAIDGTQLADSITLDAATLTFTDGSNTLLTLTDAGTTGNLSVTGDLTVSGDDLFLGTNTDAFILVADGTNFNPVAMSGDITITNAGVTSIGNDKVTEADLKAVDSATDEECLTYESTTGDFEWQTCGGAGANSFETINAPAGTDPVASSSSDTLNLTTSTSDIVITGTSGTDTLDFTIADDSLDFAQLEDTLDVDAATDINLGANLLSVDLDSTGDFAIRDGTTNVVLFEDNSTVDVTFPAAGFLTIDASSTASTTTTGVIDLNVGAGDAAVDGLNIALTSNDGVSAGVDQTAIEALLTANDADADLFGLTLTSAATANAGAGSYEALIKLVNAEDTAGAVTDAILIDSTSSTDTDITDALDVSDANIVNAVNLGANFLLGDGIRQFSSSSTVWTIEDTGGNDLLTITDAGTTGNVTVTGDLTISGDDLVMGTNTSGFILVADGTNYNPVDASGDIDIATNGAVTIQANSVALGTDTTNNYVATIADAGNSTVTVANSGSETAAVTLDVIDVNCTDCLNATAIEDIYVFNTGDTVTLAATGQLVIDASSTAQTGTSGALDINVAAGNAAVDAVNIALTANDGIDAATDIEAQVITLTANDADADLFGLVINAAATANAGAGSYEALIKLVNAEDTAAAVTDAILITTSSGTAGDIVDAIDASAGDITNALNAGANFILGDGIRQFSSSSTVWTIEDTSGNDLATITDDGTSGTLAVNTISLTGTGTINGLDAIDATTETTLEAAIDIAGDVSGTGLGSVTIGADKVLESHLKAVDSASDEECLTYETTTGDFEWQTCGAGGMTSFTLAGDTGSSQTISDGNTLTIATDDDLTATAGATDTVTIALDDDAVDGTELTDSIALDADLTFVMDAGEEVILDASSTAHTGTTGVLDLNVAAGNAAVDGINLAFTVNDGATAATDFEAEVQTLTANDADADVFGLVINSAATANAGAGSYEALIRLSNAEDAAGAVTDAILITTSSGTAGDIVDAIDASAADITNALNIGTNTITGTTGIIDLTDFDVSADGVVATDVDADTDAATLTAANTTFSNDILTLQTAEEDTGTFTFLTLISDTDGTPDTELTINQDGDITTDGAISATGAISGSDFSCTDCLDFAELEDSLDVDAATDINLGANLLSVDLDSSGDFAIRDGTTNVVLFEDNSTVDVTFPAAGFLTIDASTTANTTTSGVIDLNVAAGNAAVDGLNIAFTVNDGTTAATDEEAAVITLTADDADADLFGLVINAAATANAGAGSYEAAIKIDNAENTAGAMPDAILITATTDTGTTDAIDVSDAEIVNALNVGANTITGTTYTISGAAAIIDFTDFDVSADGVIATDVDADTDAATITAANTAFANDIVTLQTAEEDTGTFNFLTLISDTDGTPDTEVTINQDGDITTDGAITATGTISTPTLTLTGTGTINGLDAIDSTTETTLEAAIDIAGDVSGTGLGSVVIGADKVLESHLKAVDSASDEECLTYEETAGDFEWQACAGIAADSLDFVDFQDTLDVDAATDINLGANLFSVDLDSTGDFAIRDGTTNVVLFEDNSTVDVTFPAAGFLTIDASSTASTTTTGVIDLNVGAGDAAVDGLNIALTSNDGVSAGVDQTALEALLTANDADADLFGLTLTSAATANAGAGSYEALIKLVNAEDTAGAVPDAILIDSTSSTDTDITDAIDVSDANITNAVNLGANFLLGDGIRQFSSSSTVWTVEDTSGNDLLTITDAGTSGDVTVTGNLTVSGTTFTCSDCIGLGDIADSLDLDDSTTFVFDASEQFIFDASSTASTTTAGVLDLNIASGNAAVDGINLAFTSNDGATAATDQTAFELLLTANDADADLFGLVINAAATANAGAGSYEAALKIDNAENTAGSMPDAILITATTDTGTTDAIDVSDAEIVNALNVGANTITGTSYSVDASGTLTLGSSGLDALVVTTDGTGNDEVQLPTGSIGSTELLDGDLLEADLKAVDAAADEECLTYESTAGDFEWQSCGGGSTTLQQAYDADADGSDAIIALTTSDDSIEIDNPSSSGTDSAYALFIDQNDTSGVDALNIDSESTDSNAILITHAGDGTDNAAAAAISITAESGAGGLFVTRNLGAGDDDPLVEILSDHASGDQPALFIDNDPTSAIALSIDAENTDTDIIDISGAALTTGKAIDIPDLDLFTSGKGLNIASGSEAITSGELLTLALTSSGSANSAKSGALASIAASRTENRVTGTTADDYDLLGLTRTSIQGFAGGTTTAAGSVLRIENVATQTAGTLTDTVKGIELVMDADGTGDGIFIDSNATTGISINIDGEQTTGDVINFSADALTTGKAIDIPDINALTTGRGLNIASTSTAITSGELLDLDLTSSSASLTAKTGNLASASASRTSTRTSGTTADDFDLLALDRTNIQNGASGTLTAAGSVLRITNTATQTAGTLTDSVNVVEIVQDVDSSGRALDISHKENLEQVRFNDLTNTDSVGIFVGSGTPESQVTAQLGSIYFDHAGGDMWLKGSGDGTNTGWEELSSDQAHMARMTRDAAQTISNNTSTKIAFDAETFDVGGIADFTTNDRFNIAHAGKYLVTGFWAIEGALDDAEYLYAIIYKNGSEVSHNNAMSSNTNQYSTVEVTDTVDLAANDYIEMYALHNEGASVDTRTANAKPRMSVIELSKATTGADLAEVYYNHTDEALSPGTVITLDPDHSGGIMASRQPYDKNALGVISTHPGLILGDELGVDATGTPYYVGLSGRVPVRVSTENGPIAPGDFLTTSSQLGIAMKATHAGAPVIGQALAAWDKEGIGQVMTFIKNSTLPNTSFAFISPNAPATLAQLGDEDADTGTLETPFYNIDLLGAIQELEILSGKKFVYGEGEVAGTSTTNPEGNASLGASPSPLPGDLTASGALQVAGGLDVAGTLNVRSDVTLYANLVVDTVHIAQALNVHGNTTLFGNLDVQGELSVNPSQAGQAVIRRGAKEVAVKYAKEFTAEPIVQITPSDSSVAYQISKQDKTGFTVTLKQTAKADLTLNWTALATAKVEPTVAEPIDDNHNGIPDIDEEGTPLPTPESTPEQSDQPTSTPEPTPSPSAIPTPTPAAPAEALGEGWDLSPILNTTPTP